MINTKIRIQDLLAGPPDQPAIATQRQVPAGPGPVTASGRTGPPGGSLDDPP